MCLKLSISSKASLNGVQCIKATNDSATRQQLRYENKSYVPSVTSMVSRILHNIKSCKPRTMNNNPGNTSLQPMTSGHLESVAQKEESLALPESQSDQQCVVTASTPQGALTSLTVTESGVLTKTDFA